MPRRRPGPLRRSRPPKALWHATPHVPGLDRRAQHDIARIEWRTAQDWARHGL